MLSIWRQIVDQHIPDKRVQCIEKELWNLLIAWGRFNHTFVSPKTLLWKLVIAFNIWKMRETEDTLCKVFKISSDDVNCFEDFQVLMEILWFEEPSSKMKTRCYCYNKVADGDQFEHFLSTITIVNHKTNHMNSFDKSFLGKGARFYS